MAKADMPNIDTRDREQLEDVGALPIWEAIGSIIRDRTALEPTLWDGKKLFDVSKRVEENISRDEIDKTPFQTRAVIPDTPGFRGSITSTLFLGVQSFPPGDSAVDHRHPHSAPRFVVDGHEDMNAVVGGEAFSAQTNDVIITPSWEWHSHFNDSGKTVTWLSLLDITFLLHGMGLAEEEHDDAARGIDPADKPKGYYNTRFGTLQQSYRGEYDQLEPLQPTGQINRTNRSAPPTVPHRYAWEDSYEALKHAAENGYGYDPYNGVNLEFINQATGQPPATPTLSLRLQLLEAGEETEAHEHNSAELFYVVQGEGYTEFDDQRIEWGEQDLILVPPGSAHAHGAETNETILFAASDMPILGAFNLYREIDASEKIE